MRILQDHGGADLDVPEENDDSGLSSIAGKNISSSLTQSVITPGLIVILLGSNDAILQGSWVTDDGLGDHHVPLAEYKSNLQQIVQHFRRFDPDLPVIWITPPPVVDDMEMPIQRLHSETVQYKDAMLDLAKQERIPVFNLWEACEGDNMDVYPSNFFDGLHMNTK